MVDVPDMAPGVLYRAGLGDYRILHYTVLGNISISRHHTLTRLSFPRYGQSDRPRIERALLLHSPLFYDEQRASRLDGRCDDWCRCCLFSNAPVVAPARWVNRGFTNSIHVDGSGASYSGNLDRVRGL